MLGDEADAHPPPGTTRYRRGAVAVPREGVKIGIAVVRSGRPKVGVHLGPERVHGQ
jgi:hypothetical protein